MPGEASLRPRIEKCSSRENNSNVSISFYELDTGDRYHVDFSDQGWLCGLLDLYCSQRKLDRNHANFLIWKEDVDGSMTWAQLRSKHNDSDIWIDVENRCFPGGIF